MDDLPLEITTIILHFVDSFCTLWKVSLVNKKFYALIYDGSSLQNIFLNRWGDIQKQPATISGFLQMGMPNSSNLILVSIQQVIYNHSTIARSAYVVLEPQSYVFCDKWKCVNMEEHLNYANGGTAGSDNSITCANEGGAVTNNSNIMVTNTDDTNTDPHYDDFDDEVTGDYIYANHDPPPSSVSSIIPTTKIKSTTIPPAYFTFEANTTGAVCVAFASDFEVLKVMFQVLFLNSSFTFLPSSIPLSLTYSSYYRVIQVLLTPNYVCAISVTGDRAEEVTKWKNPNARVNTSAFQVKVILAVFVD